MTEQVRVRFAPSPTGYLHIGGARTALFNYLFAKSMKGTFILRIEDTDLQRSTPEAVAAIMEGLDWLNIKPDEGPYFQTKRTELYLQYAKKLLDLGHAYPCYMTPAELEALREEQRLAGEKPRYDGRFRPQSISPQKMDVPSASAARPFVIRFRAPQTGSTIFSDLVLGDVATPNEELEDMIIVRSDGSPTYNFTVVVDDIEMAITHIIRGSDHISNTPKQVAIYQALGAKLPLFAHVPMILGSDKKKLSKRHGATSVVEYSKDGYLADGFVNYMVRLGWSHGDQEIFSRTELETIFDLESVGKSAAVFDFDKLRWVNGEHIKRCERTLLVEQVKQFLPEAVRTSQLDTDPQFLLLLDALRERSATLVEMASGMSWYFNDDTALDITEEQRCKHFSPDIAPIILELAQKLPGAHWEEDGEVDALLKEYVASHSLKFGQLAQPVRLALTGSLASPPLGTIFRILGAAKVASRLIQSVNPATAAK